MKKMFLLACVLVLVAAMVSPMNAQSKIALNVGADVLMPLGTFGDAVNIGFGGSVSGEYMVMPELNLTLTSGYFTWSGKSVTVGGQSFSADFHGIPIMVGAKYYFMPAGKLRVYGAAQLGLFMASVTTPGITIGGFSVASQSVSETDFSFAPIVGVEIPAGATGNVDISVRFFSVGTSGSASNNLAARVGYKFPL